MATSEAYRLRLLRSLRRQLATSNWSNSTRGIPATDLRATKGIPFGNISMRSYDSVDAISIDDPFRSCATSSGCPRLPLGRIQSLGRPGEAPYATGGPHPGRV